MELRQWLEELSCGSIEASFIYDTEGSHHIWKFTHNFGEKGIFTVQCEEDEGGDIFSVQISRLELIKTAYLAFNNFFKSEKYDKSEWEIVRMRDLIEEKIENPSEYLPLFANLDSNELKEFLFNLNPEYTVSYPDISDPKEIIKIAVREAFNKNEETGKTTHKVLTPAEYDIPEGYDQWTTVEKIEFIDETLNEVISPWYGTKAEDFRSKIVENYLIENDINYSV